METHSRSYTSEYVGNMQSDLHGKGIEAAF